MGVQTYNVEVSSSVAPTRLFKALYLDSHTLFPKIAPETFKSIEFLQGDSVKAGAVKQINFAEGHPLKYVKNRYDEVDVENLYVKYATIEGDVLEDRVEFVVHEVKFVASGSGTVCTLTNHYHPKGDVVLDEEKIKVGQGKLKELFKKVEEYLLANPNAYA